MVILSSFIWRQKQAWKEAATYLNVILLLRIYMEMILAEGEV